MENVGNQVYVRLVNDTVKDYLKLVARPSFLLQKAFQHNLVAVHKIRNLLTLKKSAHVGVNILKLTVTLVYDYIKNLHGNKIKLILITLNVNKDFYDD